MTSTTARRTGLALAGLAVAGTAMVGMAGTAQAAQPAQPAKAVANWGGGWDNDSHVAGVFRSYRQCRWAGVRGERWGRWDDFDCDFVGGGGWGGTWQSSWGTPFNQFWSGGGWRYRGVWVLRVQDC
jgi:hypothetical protein